MKQQNLLDPIPADKIATLPREKLEEFARLEQEVRLVFQKRVAELEAELRREREQTILLKDQYLLLKSEVFGRSSEKEFVQNDVPEVELETMEGFEKPVKTRVQLPSLRYPHADLLVQDIEFKELPNCHCCGSKMTDSGLTEVSEFLTVVPKQFMVVRQRRRKYRCGKCHGDIQTAPSLPRITPGSSYSDEMAIDVAVSKYCDLIPVERYATMAGREGLEDLPPQSLIELTHNLAEFIAPAVARIREQEIKQSTVLHADETPHRMLEGAEKSNWYLWGFSTKTAAYFEAHGTRSGDVAASLLKEAKCQYLVSDVFSGYSKAVRETNEERKACGRPEIRSLYCNAHARRKFKEARERFTEAQFYLDRYRRIYRLEAEVRERPLDECADNRRQMRTLFEELKSHAMQELPSYSSKSAMARAIEYFLKNYVGLTLFLTAPEFPIDNNPQERLLRSPVIGRKTWYGTHSERGAQTMASFFTIVESCKLVRINPREYLKNLVQRLHLGEPIVTPSEFQQLQLAATPSAG